MRAVRAVLWLKLQTATCSRWSVNIITVRSSLTIVWDYWELHIPIDRLLEGGIYPNEGWAWGFRFATKCMKQLLAVCQLKCSFVNPHFWKQLKPLVRATPSLKQSTGDWIFCRVYFSRSQTLREWDGSVCCGPVSRICLFVWMVGWYWLSTDQHRPVDCGHQSYIWKKRILLMTSFALVTSVSGVLSQWLLIQQWHFVQT